MLDIQLIIREWFLDLTGPMTVQTWVLLAFGAVGVIYMCVVIYGMARNITGESFAVGSSSTNDAEGDCGGGDGGD